MKYSKKYKLKLKSGDFVKVIAGNYKNKKSNIIKIDKTKGKVYLKDINVVIKHVKSNNKNNNGKIIKKEAPIDISNVMIIDPSCSNISRIGRKINIDSGKLNRYYKKSQLFIK